MVLEQNITFSTWADGKKLESYPENYLDPTVCLGQTAMMEQMQQQLGQAQINTDTVGDAFMEYLTGFEEVANLETVSGYHDNEDPEEGKTWFVGRTQLTPREYWWRSVDEGKRNQEGVLPANAWTGWNKITCAPQPFSRLIRPVVYKTRLYIGWVERTRYATEKSATGEEIAWKYRWELKISWLRYDKGWSQPAVYEYPADDADKLEALVAEPDGLSLYLTVWPAQQMMIAGVYKKGTDSEEDFKGEVNIYEDMSISAGGAAAANWVSLVQVRDTAEVD
ncbi:neuraminidase-like domain-containing protein [Serratia quinivorans]|uniref:neuraminidase-like domain-containing protein n=1 Tax=Serratia quinivorans TaxID=137545 RepID=UPI001C48EFAD|nr:neuraminidase-like domain-containing protein [Serratia quinivorans]MBV6694323.1 hypothetical protein [Serratia quinivorans]